ncbi:MAG: TetR/AcrR family transcriptional regulator [Acidimicrobiales bacterium]
MPGGAARGRPRDPSREEAIRDAVFDLLVEVGYPKVTIEAVAARAGAGKATLYRRWKSKAELVVAVLDQMACGVQTADTGSLRTDLERQVCRDLAVEPGSRVIEAMQGLGSALRHDVALRTAFTEHFVAPRRAAMAEMFARAEARGEMPPGKDIDLLTSVVPALMMHRLMTGRGHPGPAYARQIVEKILLPAATCPAPAPPARRRRAGTAPGRSIGGH